MSLAARLADFAARVALDVKGKAPIVHSHTTAQISDGGAVGRNVVKGASLVAAQEALGIFQLDAGATNPTSPAAGTIYVKG